MKKRTKLIVVAVLILVIAGTASYWAIWGRGTTAESSEPTEEKVPEQATSLDNGAMGPNYTFEAFIVNVAGTSGRRYLKCSVTVEFDVASGPSEAATKVPLLRDAIIDVLSSKTLEDLEPGTVRNDIRGELVSVIAPLISKAEVTRVFFNEFVVQ